MKIEVELKDELIQKRIQTAVNRALDEAGRRVGMQVESWVSEALEREAIRGLATQVRKEMKKALS